MNTVTVYHLGTVEYKESCRLQEDLALARASGALDNTLLMLEHPPVITIGRDGGDQDLLATQTALRKLGVCVASTDRGGRATYHGPGQLVVYPILRPANGDFHAYVWQLEETAIRVLSSYGLRAGRVQGQPGVWLTASNGSGRDHKIASVGLAVRDGISRHGLALNVAPEMSHFDLLVSCGNADGKATSMAQELGWTPDLSEVANRFLQIFGEVLHCQVVEGDASALPKRHRTDSEQPEWLWQRLSPQDQGSMERMEALLHGSGLHTVCQAANCPNIAECFGRGTATFMILGDTCSRACRFCAVKQGSPVPLDPGEPERVAGMAFRLNLQHVVLTSVTRDDLSDGGAFHFGATVQAIRDRSPHAVIELLIPDLGGSKKALETILAAGPDILNHNLETVDRLYPRVRPGAGYRRSLAVLAWAKDRAPGITTKSGLMLGLGETTAEVMRALHDLRRARCDLLTLGQYLQPANRQLAVERYIPPNEFANYQAKAESMGFRGVAAGPLVRSSHQAEALWHKTVPPGLLGKPASSKNGGGKAPVRQNRAFTPESVPACE